MVSRTCCQFVIAFTLLVVFATMSPVCGQNIGGFNFGGNSNNNSNDNNSNDQKRRRGNRNREEDNSSDFQQLQNFIQGSQNDSGNPQQFRRRGQQGGQFQIQGGQFNSQQLQNMQQGGQNNWPLQHRRSHKDVQNFVLQFGGSTPFSVEWYKDHPQAMQLHHHHDHDDAWKAATVAGVLGWLGWHAHDDHHHHHHHPVVIYEPVPYETFFVEGRPHFDPTVGQWMTLGVYSLITGPGDTGSRLLQLYVDKHGHIRGTCYDMISNTTQNVAGLIDQRTQHVQWSLESHRHLTFFAPLSQLTQSQGVVNVLFPSGQRQQWQLVRLEGAHN